MPDQTPYIFLAVVVAQMMEWLLLTPEIRGSNPVSGKLYLLSTLLKIDKKRLRMAQIEEEIISLLG